MKLALFRYSCDQQETDLRYTIIILSLIDNNINSNINIVIVNPSYIPMKIILSVKPYPILPAES